MKGDLDASKAVRQLQAGADIADAHIIPVGEPVQFYPVAVFVAGCTQLNKIDYRSLPVKFASGRTIQHPVIKVWSTLK